MDILTNTSHFSVNRYSDFQLEFELVKDGAPYIPDGFVMVFYTEEWDDCEGHYMASFIGGECVNCSVNGTTIRVFFNSPGFSLGTLKCRILDKAENLSFDDGTLDTCIPMTMPVEIVAGQGDSDTIVLGYGAAYFGDNHDLVLEGASSPAFGNDNNLEI